MRKTVRREESIDSPIIEGTASAGSPKVTTQDGAKRYKARDKLLEAAFCIMGESGLASITIADICTRSGTGIGSFYRNFSSKEDLARAVFTQVTEEYCRETRDLILATADPLLGACYGQRAIIEKAEREAIWATFLTNVAEPLGMVDELIRQPAIEGMDMLLRRAKLEIRDLPLRIMIALATIHAAIRQFLAGEISSREAHRTAAYLLLMHGFPWAESLRAAELSMDELREEMRRNPAIVDHTEQQDG